MNKGSIIKISGPLVVASGLEHVKLYDTVAVGHQELLGEIIEVRGDKASIQVYEETSGIYLHEPVYSYHEPLSVELGPGILSSMLDGTGRNLSFMARDQGVFMERGAAMVALSREALWEFIPLVQNGQEVSSGEAIGYVIENNSFKHYILVPNKVSGTVSNIAKVTCHVDDVVARINGHDVTMIQKWPVRIGRPYAHKHLPHEPLITGQRIIDTFFPVTKGGTACIPGPFGSGKTVVQHQLAKWSNSDVVIYIGCGERGNEMTDVLYEFPQIIDPITKQPLMDKTVLITNTSNMPVAAREASIYTGMTIAEYFRDMGYDVSMMADSTSRWAEALREMSGRLGEMPGDEGYPAYLASRLAQVYERAGSVECIGNGKDGSVTMIGAVSPAGGDLSEPVTQSTLRIAKVFWGLDARLAYERHFPAINWNNSYSLYQQNVDKYMNSNVDKSFAKNRVKAMNLLKDEQRLLEITQLIGKDTLSDDDLLSLEVAKMLREDFLQQNAFQEEDTFTSLGKQAKMLEIIMDFYTEARVALQANHIFIADIFHLQSINQIPRMKFVPESEIVKLDEIKQSITSELNTLKNREVSF